MTIHAVHILHKWEPQDAPSEAQLSTPLMKQEEHASSAPKLNYQGITNTLASGNPWIFDPYPPCTRRQLQQIQTYIVAVDIGSAADAEQLTGVLGLVWVPLNGGSQEVEGYIQVVLIHPHHRRRGIAKKLLRACLDMKKALIASKEERAISRWRLHTLLSSPNTTEYLRSYYPSQDTANEQSNSKDSVVFVEDMLAMSRATVALYEGHAFVQRRVLPKYYEGAADGVEMVRQERQTCRKHPRDSV